MVLDDAGVDLVHDELTFMLAIFVTVPVLVSLDGDGGAWDEVGELVWAVGAVVGRVVGRILGTPGVAAEVFAQFVVEFGVDEPVAA